MKKMPQRLLPVLVNSKFKPLFLNKFAYYGFPGGRVTAKSHNAAAYAIISAMKGPEIIVTGRENKNANDYSTKRLYEKKIRAFGYEKHFYITQREIICKKTGTIFNFVGLQHNPDSLRSFEGATITILEEAQNIGQRAFDSLLPTIFRTPKARLICLWNPMSPADAVDRLFRGSRPLPRSYCAPLLTYRDNPYFTAPELAVIREQMEHMRATDPAKYRHVWEGEYFGGVQKRIFNNWEVAAIEPQSNMPPQYGLDFGSTRDPNAMVKLYVNDLRKEIYIAAEFYAPGNFDVLDYGLAHITETEFDTVICDSAWPQSIAYIKQKYPNAQSARKGPNSVAEGINWLQSYKIIIHPSCKNMIAEADLYSWQTDPNRVNDDGSPFVLNIPASGHDHLWDAVRYATEQNRCRQNIEPRICRLVF